MFALLPVLAALGGALFGGGGSGSGSGSGATPSDPELQAMIKKMLNTENARLDTQNPLYTAVSKLAMGMLPTSVSPGVGGVPNLFNGQGGTGYSPGGGGGIGGGPIPRPGTTPVPRPGDTTPLPPVDPGDAEKEKKVKEASASPFTLPTSAGGSGINLDQMATLFSRRYGR